MESLVSIFLIVSSFLLLLGVVKLAYSVWWKPEKLQKQLLQQGIRGSPYKLLLGDLKELGNAMKEAWSKPMNLNHQILSRVIPFDHKTVQDYGKVSFYWLATTPRVIIQDSELVKEVLSNIHIQKPPIPPVMRVLGMGLTSLEGEEWVQRRKLMNPAFHLEKLKGMVSAISDSCVELIKRWEELIMSSQGSCELDVWPEFQSFTLDVISKTAFSSSYNEGKKIFDLQKELIQLVIESISTSFIPGFRFLPTRNHRRIAYLDKEIKKALTDLICKRQAAMERGESGRVDLLGLLLQPSDNAGRPGLSLSIQQATEECKTMYVAGQETTASLLTWTLIVLSMNPRWQEEARTEVFDVCGENSPEFESINRLKIVPMILNEVLRLYPSVVAVYRHTYESTKVGDFLIPSGVDLVLPSLLIHHDPELWGEDAEEFKPVRFSGGVSKASRTRNGFVPFGAGPKTCIGQNLAMVEAKMALATILQRFSFQLSPSYTHAPYTVITLQPQHGAQLILRKL
ncbi:hypothetical protein H6P81_014093 [Aristolochia fimbriata]|uniref:Cytochrome P450 n=1 Tax=Aristolochia fimbriata TaxID=158543 RepID=A0AAV7EGJ6_ARIFI|nr:hypothetical protein H6P81_014093 [Aristolochia fimbriata]